MQMDTLLLFHFSLSDPIPHCPLQTFRIVLNGIAYFSMAVSSGIVMSREAMRTERHFKLKILFRMIHKLDLASASPGVCYSRHCWADAQSFCVSGWVVRSDHLDVQQGPWQDWCCPVSLWDWSVFGTLRTTTQRVQRSVLFLPPLLRFSNWRNASRALVSVQCIGQWSHLIITALLWWDTVIFSI